MEAVFLGTGAAQGNPAAYCRCSSCEQIRRSGGFDTRSRSSMRVGAHHQLDVPPDNYQQMVNRGMDMYDIEHILVTHTHSDHLCLSAVTDKAMSTVTNEKPLSVYMANPAKELIEAVIRAYGKASDYGTHHGTGFELIGLDYYMEYQVGELRVETVRGNHKGNGKDESSINYLIAMPEGTKLLYALDTGYYTDESWEFLSGRKADTVVLDSTFGGRTDRGEYPSGHLDNASVIRMLERMQSIGFIDDRAEIYATHFNPHQGLNHVNLQKWYDESDFNVTVAYDGLRIEV